jgi:hypothetical protein
MMTFSRTNNLDGLCSLSSVLVANLVIIQVAMLVGAVIAGLLLRSGAMASLTRVADDVEMAEQTESELIGA